MFFLTAALVQFPATSMTSATTYSRTAAKYTEAPLFICGAKSPLESRLWTRLTGKISPARFD